MKKKSRLVFKYIYHIVMMIYIILIAFIYWIEGLKHPNISWSVTN